MRIEPSRNAKLERLTNDSQWTTCCETRELMKAGVLFAVPFLAASCGAGAGSSVGPANTTPIGDGGTVVDNGGTVQFAVAKAYITRGQWCGTPPPFTSGDVFELVL